MSFYINPRTLPVYTQRERILETLAQNQVIVVESPTGSGKTTQLPLILHQAGYSQTGVIGITQPRRIAAVSVSEYIADQVGSPIPGLVGYKMRFEDQTSQETRIKIMTDGILLQELKHDPYLSRYSVIMVDEAHERSLNIDFILGLLKTILEHRPDFKVIISSATINTDIFSEYFNSCPVVHIETQVFPVQVIYDPIPADLGREFLLDKIKDIVKRYCENWTGKDDQGDVLIFLPGEKDINDCLSLLDLLPCRKKLVLVPLYGRLGKEEQEKVFIPTPPGKIKIVAATNIAETSVTINGITMVIDSGLAKLNHYNPRTYTSALVESNISRASANQRKGRAGRTRPGVCYRLCAKKDFDSLPLYTKEEIYRTDLSEVVLRMAELGIRDFEAFDFISPPGKQGIHGAVETLHLLDALTSGGELSEIGRMMAQFPLLPRHSRMIVEAVYKYPGVIEETIVAAAFLSAHTPFLIPPGEEMTARKAHHRFRDDLGDFVSYLKLLEQFRTAQNKEKFCESNYLDLKIMNELVNITVQLGEIVGEIGVPLGGGGSMEDYLCAVSRGLIQFVCASTGNGVFRSLTAEKIRIHPGSVMFRTNPPYIVAGEVVKTSQVFARSVSPLTKAMIKKISPEMAASFFDRKAPGPEKAKGKETRDTTWELRVGRFGFELKPGKNKKKVAQLPWEVMRQALAELPPFETDRLQKLRGVVIFREYHILSGFKLPKIFQAMRHIDPERDMLAALPPRKNFKTPEQLDRLCGYLDELLKLSPMGKKGKDTRQLGFLSLENNGQHQYWYRLSRNYFQCVENSLASLEMLADQLDPGVPGETVEKINATYRRLSALLENRTAPG